MRTCSVTIYLLQRPLLRQTSLFELKPHGLDLHQVNLDVQNQVNMASRSYLARSSGDLTESSVVQMNNSPFVSSGSQLEESIDLSRQGTFPNSLI